MKSLKCATFDLNEAKEIDVEAAFVRALPGFSIVGLAQTSIQESKERIKSALSFINFTFPPMKITINLSPSDLKKEGSHFDLPIALLIALQNENIDFEDFFVFGELGLDGKVKDTKNLFPIILSLSKNNILKKVLIPKESVYKISKIPKIDIYAISSLEEAIEFFKNPEIRKKEKNEEFNFKFIEIDREKYYFLESFPLDFFEVRGQERAKRASLIAAAGMHNILFNGSPGCGKSMCAKRVRYIMPPMSLKEILENAKLQILEDKECEFKPVRNFRAPHHTSSKASIFGGGSKSAKIGEVALANEGILFFDELPLFQKSVLESLREPLEDHKLLISRVNSKVLYETKFLFIGAMNPCPCGNLLSQSKSCRCSDLEIKRYKNRLSSPLLDRIDLYVEMEEVKEEDKESVTSKEMFEKVKKAFLMQKRRGQKNLNGKLNDQEIKKYCKISIENQNIINQAIKRFSLSNRAVNKVLKVSRTIADISQREEITKSDILEALSYRIRE